VKKTNADVEELLKKEREELDALHDAQRRDQKTLLRQKWDTFRRL
jgi:hypothetical protein